MATIQHPKPQAEDGDLTEPYIQPGHTLPGYTVDRLIEQGKLDEARQELERLLLEGLDSGTSRSMTAELMQEIIDLARARASQRIA